MAFYWMTVARNFHTMAYSIELIRVNMSRQDERSDARRLSSIVYGTLLI